MKSYARALWAQLTATDTVAEGQGLVEYALIILFVVLACVATLTGLGQALAPYFQRVADAFP